MTPWGPLGIFWTEVGPVRSSHSHFKETDDWPVSGLGVVESVAGVANEVFKGCRESRKWSPVHYAFLCTGRTYSAKWCSFPKAKDN
jgi:hypothetical protein